METSPKPRTDIYVHHYHVNSTLQYLLLKREKTRQQSLVSPKIKSQSELAPYTVCSLLLTRTSEGSSSTNDMVRPINVLHHPNTVIIHVNDSNNALTLSWCGQVFPNMLTNHSDVTLVSPSC